MRRRYGFTGRRWDLGQ